MYKLRSFHHRPILCALLLEVLTMTESRSASMLAFVVFVIGMALALNAGAQATLEPKCQAFEKGAKCWKEVADKPGCHVWDDYSLPHQTVTWSGSCSGGIADGQGELIWTRHGKSFEMTGSLSHGKMSGHWVIRWSDGAVSEGPYVEGESSGHFVIRWPNGTVEEGPYVEGERSGLWVVRYPAGEIEEGHFVEGWRDGDWIDRRPDGSCWSYSYVRGELRQTEECS